MIDTDLISRARSIPIAHVLRSRSIRLRPAGQELTGPCPVCGGTDRFAVHLRKQVWNCRQCRRGGDVIALVQHLDGVGFADAVSMLAGGERPRPAPRRAPETPTAAPVDRAAEEDRKQRQALQWWGEAVPIAGTIAEQYLRAPKLQGGRNIDLSSPMLPPDLSPRVLRFHPHCPFGEGARHPCLLALYRDIATDEPRAIMRTALTPDGHKIDRKAMGPVGGCAVKLSDDADVTMSLTIGEGLETTLAGLLKGFSPAWALGSDSGIAKFQVRAGVEALTILGEKDATGANERAVKECAARWLAADRAIYRLTSTIGGDLNDALMNVT
jgi:hypothetical protein